MLHVHSIGGVCDDETAEKVEAAIRTGVSHCRGTTAILSRCNLSVFSAAVRLTDVNPHCRIHFIGVSVYILTVVYSRVSLPLNSWRSLPFKNCIHLDFHPDVNKVWEEKNNCKF